MFQIKTGCPKRNVPKRRSSLLTKEHFLGHPVCCESSGYFKFQQKSRKNLKLEWVHIVMVQNQVYNTVISLVNRDVYGI